MMPASGFQTSWRYCRTRPKAAVLATLVAAGGSTCLLAAYLLLNAIFLRPIPGIPNADQLAIVSVTNSDGAAMTVPLSFFDQLRPTGPEFDSWCPISNGGLSRVERDGRTSSRPATLWTAECASVLRIRPALGSLWPAAGDPNVPVVLGHTYWEREFSSDPGVLGRPLVVDDVHTTIIGVAPKNFTGLNIEIEPAVILPVDYRSGTVGSPGFRYLVGRRSAGAERTVDSDMITARLRALVLESGGISQRQRDGLLSATVTADTTGRGYSYFRELYGDALRVMSLGAGLLLLTALLSIAGLTSSEIMNRRMEFEVRRALGASRFGSILQLTSEGILPIAVGTLIAIPTAVVLAQRITAGIWTSATPLTLSIGISADAVAVAAGVAAAMLLASSIAAVLTLGSGDQGLHRRDSVTRSSQTAAGLLLSGQVAVSVALTLLAALIAQSVSSLESVDLGYRSSGLVFGRLLPARSTLPPNDANHYARLLELLATRPEVRGAAYSQSFPNQTRGSVSTDALALDGFEASVDVVSESYFDTVGLPLIEGRLFTPADSGSEHLVAVISRSLSLTVFGNQSPLGKRLVLAGSPPTAVEVVGVVGDVRLAGAREPFSQAFYRPRSQTPAANPVILAHATSTSGLAARALNDTVGVLGRDYVGTVNSVEEYTRRALAPERTLRLLGVTFSGFVLLVSGLGLFALQAAWVARQKRHTCIRLALGEAPLSALFRISRHSFVPVAVGVVIGLPCAMITADLARSVLFGISAFDAQTCGLVASFFLALGLAVSLIPTIEILRLNVVEVLKS